MIKKIVCILLTCIMLVFQFVLAVGAAKETEVKMNFPFAIAHSTAFDVGIEKNVSGIEALEVETQRVILETNATDVFNAEGKNVLLMVVFCATVRVKGSSITVGKGAVADPNNNTLFLKEGMVVAFSDLIAAVLYSNDINAARTLAIGIGGSVENFVIMMNSTARSVGMLKTKYTNVDGKFDANQVTTIDDLITLAICCYKNETITDITSTSSYFLKTPDIAGDKKTITNSFPLLNQSSEMYNSNIFGIGTSKDSKGVTTSIVSYISSKQKFIFVLRSTGNTYLGDIKSTLEFVKKNYALMDVSKTIFELFENYSIGEGNEKIYFAPMKNTVSKTNVVVNLFYSKSVSKLSEAYSVKPPDNIPEHVNIGDIIPMFKILYNGNEISSISLTVKSIGEQVEEEKTLGFTLYQKSDVVLKKGNFIQEHSWVILVVIMVVIGMVVIIGVNRFRNI